MKPEEKQGLTTGEAARMLGITQYTATKLFERGVLTGWKHPVTKYRVIDLKSVRVLARKLGIKLASTRQIEKNLKELKWKRNITQVKQEEG